MCSSRNAATLFLSSLRACSTSLMLLLVVVVVVDDDLELTELKKEKNPDMVVVEGKVEYRPFKRRC